VDPEHLAGDGEQRRADADRGEAEREQFNEGDGRLKHGAG
jgi:hypothetical protein